MPAVRSKTKLRRLARQAGLGAWLDTLEMVDQSPPEYRGRLVSVLESRADTHARAMFPLMVWLSDEERARFSAYLKNQAAHVATMEARAYLAAQGADVSAQENINHEPRARGIGGL